MNERLAKLLYKLLKPFIEVEWEQSIESYGTVFRIRIFGTVVSDVVYSPDMKSLRERFERTK